MSITEGRDAATANAVNGARGSWRDHLPIHPAADLFPLMSESELRELGEDIKENGLKSHLKLHKGKLLDGRNRLEAMELVGVPIDLGDDIAALGCPFDHLDGRVDPYDYVISVNLQRRHLTPYQKRELIAVVLRAKPGASNRKIARQVKADHKTVAAVRTDLESTGEIPQLEKTEGADGKQRKSRARKTPKPTPDEIERDRKECVVLHQKVIEAEKEAARATGSAEISIEQRQAENAALADPIEEESAPETEEERWRRYLRNMAGESVSLPEVWTRERWEKFKATPDLITLAEHAAEAWADIAALLKSNQSLNSGVAR